MRSARILRERDNIPLLTAEREDRITRAVSWHGFNFPAKYTRVAYIWRIGRLFQSRALLRLGNAMERSRS